MEIVVQAEEGMTKPMLYVHVPFCGSKCAYCAFVSHAPAPAQRTREVGGWLAALAAEADLRLGKRATGFSTVFIGGGTPTFLAETELEVLLSVLERYVPWGSVQEITMEANPDSLTRAKGDILRRYGVNRISLGVQSLEDSVLHTLGRRHTRADVRRVVDILRKQEFTNINFDLMFGLPGQDMDIWRRTIKEAVGLEPEHLSLYGLSVEAGTPLACWQVPDDDIQADMYEWAVGFLKEQGYERYEISNFCREGFCCRHNERTWRGKDYIGLGPSAVSTMKGVRRTNSNELDIYIEGMKGGQERKRRRDYGENREGDEGIFYTVEGLTKEQQMCEYMILGLRTNWGVEREAFYHRFGVELEGVFGQALEKHIHSGVLNEERGRIFLKPRYFFVANAVMRDFAFLGQ